MKGKKEGRKRTFVVGEPTAQQSELYEVVQAAQRAGVAAVRAGISVNELDGVCRGIITEAGYGDWFSHGTGHGVGLLIHEDPFVNKAGDAILQAGDRLPTIRQMAIEAHINFNTVARAYRVLDQAGVISTQHGRGRRSWRRRRPRRFRFMARRRRR